MIERKHISTGTPWESVVGYSRAVRVGNRVLVSGTSPIDANGMVVGVGDPYAQGLQCLRNIESALTNAKASITDVVRTRIFVTNIDHWKEVGKAHGEYFRDVRPASSLVQVSCLILPEMLVEIEAEAVLDEVDS